MQTLRNATLSLDRAQFLNYTCDKVILRLPAAIRAIAQSWGRTFHIRSTGEATEWGLKEIGDHSCKEHNSVARHDCPPPHATPGLACHRI